MRIRDAVLQNRYALNDDGTWTFPINLVDPVTEFKIWFFAKNHGTGPNEAGAIPYLIDEIAIIDGSEVIASLNGSQAFAVSALDQVPTPYHHHQEHDAMSQYWCLPIHFGRFLEDPEYIFDPSRFRNPQIRVTWDLANMAAVGANGYATGEAQISVWAKIMEEGANPRGYLMTKEIKSFVSEAAGDEVTYLPTDFDIRKLFIRAQKRWEANCLVRGALTSVFTNLKLSQDEDKWVPWDLNIDDFIFLMHDWFDEIDIHLRNQGDDDEDREHYMDAYSYGTAVGGETDDILGISGFADNGYTIHAVDDAGSGASDTIHWVEASGVTPMSTLCYPFGDQEDPQDWLSVGNIGNLRLILSQGAADYNVEIVVQQAHPY